MVEIALWNTRTRRKEFFEPLDRSNVRMYACGPTVYSRAHIGNARFAVAFDTLFLLLRHVFGESNVTYVRNITDVDDKINAQAADLKEQGDRRPINEIVKGITDETIGWYHQDMRALGARSPTVEPRATQYISEMITMISTLIDRGHAYAVEGHVLFETETFPDYGRLAKRTLDEMKLGARVEVAPYKKCGLDFVLWKPSTPELPGWESPWGRGRPGWHIECSAMAHALLGPTFDIHAGGIDLAFPHHENEIAQSRCAHPEGEFAKYWLHNGFLQVEGRKMAKSLGNFITVKDLRDKGVAGDVIRLVLLSAHYRQPLDWAVRKVSEANSILRRWQTIVALAPGDSFGCPDPELVEALADDLNTPRAMSVLHRLASDRNGASLRVSARLLGLNLDPKKASVVKTDNEVAELVCNLLAAREEARKKRDFARADLIRDRLLSVGLTISDSVGRTRWAFGPEFDRSKLMELSGANGGSEVAGLPREELASAGKFNKDLE